MGTAARTVIGVVGVVTVWLVLATTLFSGTGPAGPAPEPRACVASTAPPPEDVRVDQVQGAATTAGVAACTELIPSR
jgi:hypothetical protein